ncbi:glycoside hydrolase family protein [Chryseobacterium gleum]|uniref:glycoside hydrolase family protein n=1 Tax=Chryseobacterium gleum TaxID=250 RepID=UPI00374CA3EE
MHNTHRKRSRRSFEARSAGLRNTVAKKITVPMTQNQFDALVSHTYNTGGSDGFIQACE